MRTLIEYRLCKNVAYYLRLQYPKILFRFDMAGLNLSKAQAGMNKAIQYGKGWPDLFICEPNHNYAGLFIELKTEGFKVFKQSGGPVNPHLDEQNDCLNKLRAAGYYTCFACGFDEAVLIIDNYLKGKL